MDARLPVSCEVRPNTTTGDGRGNLQDADCCRAAGKRRTTAQGRYHRHRRHPPRCFRVDRWRRASMDSCARPSPLEEGCGTGRRNTHVRITRSRPAAAFLIARWSPVLAALPSLRNATITVGVTGQMYVVPGRLSELRSITPPLYVGIAASPNNYRKRTWICLR
jgi:hypothetical protein